MLTDTGDSTSNPTLCPMTQGGAIRFVPEILIVFKVLFEQLAFFAMPVTVVFNLLRDYGPWIAGAYFNGQRQFELLL